jgi:dihydrofolate reductase
MGIIQVFNHVSVDGFFAGPHGEIDWFQAVHDDEWNRYQQENADLSNNTLMFGHTTYEMMESFWSTPAAMQVDPRMAEVMNNSPKIVFSKTLRSVEESPNWKNIRLYPEIKPEEIIKLKEKENITILGSGTIVQQLTNLGLIDDYSLVVVPVILGEGKPLFKDAHRINLDLVEARGFGGGIAFMHYQPKKG